MTTPRDAIAGLSERLREDISQLVTATSQARFTGAGTGVRVKDPSALLDDLTEAATQLDSLLKEREALQARVKELEARQADDLAEFGLMEMRALRAEQERDEAYERLKPFAKGWWSHQNPKVKISAIFNHNPFDERVLCTVGEMQAAYSLVRRLAAVPEKEKS